MTTPLRIAVHMGTLRGAGSGLVGRHLLKHLLQAPSPHRFFVWIPDQWSVDELDLASFPPRRLVVSRLRSGVLSKFAFENMRLPLTLRRIRADVLFSVGDTSALRPGPPHLLFVHQSFLAHHPTEWGFQPAPHLRTKMALMNTYFRLGLPSVDRLVVQTHYMREHIAARFRLDPSRIDVVPSAIDQAAIAALPPPIEPVGPPYLAVVGTASPHKRYVVLAEMLYELRDHPHLACRLTVSPAEVPDLVHAATRLGVLHRLLFHGRVSNETSLQLTRDALALVMPSELESFGLPYYEAMALGTPVVAADRGFARDALAELGFYATHRTGAEYADAVRRVMAANRPELSRRLRERFATVSWSWHRIARRFIDLLEEVVDDRRQRRQS